MRAAQLRSRQECARLRRGCPGRQVSSISRAAILPTRIFGPSAHQIGPSPSQTAIGVQIKAAAAARMVAGIISSSIILR